MQTIFQSAKRLISMCLVTLLVVTSVLTISPAPASADNNIIKLNVQCESDCASTAAFAAGAVAGSAVTIIATGSTGSIAAEVAGMAAFGSVAVVNAITPLAAVAAPVLAAVTPLLIPFAATAAVIYRIHWLFEADNNSQASDLR